MRDIENIEELITVLRTEATFKDQQVRSLIFNALECVNKDCIKGGYLALPRTVEAIDKLINYVADKNVKNEAPQRGVKRITLDDDDDD